MGARSSSALLLALSLSAAACADSLEAPDPTASPASAPVAGLDTVAAEKAVVDFLVAYARAGQDVEELSSLVTGRPLRDWVHWLGVQNAGLRERLTGQVQIRDLRVLRLDDQAAVAALDATVVFVLEGGTEQDRVAPRRFESPVTLARGSGDPGEWAVADVVRDGRPMTRSITVLDPPSILRERGVEVKIASVYRFSSGTVVNVRVANQTGRRARIDAPHSILQVEGRFMGSTGATTSLLSGLRSGRRVDGALDFPAIALSDVPELVIVRLVVGGRERDLVIRLPAEEFAEPGL